jgi:hypothetical protein
MYIIEKLIKLYFKFKNRDENIKVSNGINSDELEDVVTCNHNFMPIDSTGRILACSKCGYLITKKRASGKIKNK